MSLKSFKDYWHNPGVRIGFGLFVLIAAACGQYYLANVALPVDLAATNKFSPATIKLGEQELIVDHPVVSPSSGVILAHNGNANEAVDINLENARLDQETLDLFRGLGIDPPSMAGEVSFTTQNSAGKPIGGEACRTFLKIQMSDPSKPLEQIHFYQLEAPALDKYRQLEIRSIGQDLILHIATELPPGGTNESPGCRKLLRVGDWQQYVNGSLGIDFVASAGSSFRVRFEPVVAGGSSWSGQRGFLEAFTLGSPKLRLSDPPPLQARGIAIRRQDEASSTLPGVLIAKTTEGQGLLVVDGLKIGSDQLQISVSGRGKVTVNGEELTVDLLERAKRYPIPAGLLATANAALLAWLARIFTQVLQRSRRKGTDSQPETIGAAKKQKRRKRHAKV